MNAPTTIDKLKQLGYRAKPWSLEGFKDVLQITSTESGPAHGMSIYVSADATLERAIERIGEKRAEFINAANTVKE